MDNEKEIKEELEQARNDSEHYSRYRDDLLQTLKEIYDENPELVLRYRPNLIKEMTLVRYWKV